MQILVYNLNIYIYTHTFTYIHAHKTQGSLTYEANMEEQNWLVYKDQLLSSFLLLVFFLFGDGDIQVWQ